MTDIELEQSAPLGETTDRLVCPKCKTKLEKEQVKCPQCGTVIEEEDEVEESLRHWGDEIVYPEDLCET